VKTAVLLLLAFLVSAAPSTPLRAGDLDKDGIDDAAELAVARAFSPSLVWSPDESCGKHETFFQVHPDGPRRVLITYVVTFPKDCGFPAFGLGSHPGDTQEFRVQAVTDGKGWRAADLQMTWFPHVPLNGERPRIWVSAGKHHLYPSLEGCKRGLKGKLEHCGGGVEAVETLAADHNAGERGHPLLTSLARFGYSGETAWGRSDWGDELFCGGEPKRGGNGGLSSKLKHIVAWGTCGETMGLKWR